MAIVRKMEQGTLTQGFQHQQLSGMIELSQLLHSEEFLGEEEVFPLHCMLQTV